MPYIDQTRPCAHDVKVFPDPRGWWTINNVRKDLAAGAIRGTERLWGYRSGRSLERSVSQQLTGAQIRDLIYSDQDFDLDSFGGITVTGERASNEVLWPYDNGHNLRLLRSDQHLSGYDKKIIPGTCYTTGEPVVYNGPVYLYKISTLTNPYTAPSWSDTAESNSDYQRANRALARLSPKAPSANIVRAAGELLKDGVPFLTGMKLAQSMPFTRRNRGPLTLPSDKVNVGLFGDEYLNLVFGAQPTVQDFQRIAKNIVRSSWMRKELQKIVNDGFYKVRRRSTLLDEKGASTATGILGVSVGSAADGRLDSISDTFLSLFKQAGSTIPNCNRVSGSVTWSYERAVHLNCEYMVYLEDLTDLSDRLSHYEDEADRFLGLKLDASVIYELTPWTWMLNWFSDFGGYIQRAEALASDSIALRWGYISRSYSVTEAIHTDYPLTRVNGRPFPLVPTIVESYSRSRWRATPYGFGLNVADFSAAKWAILAALGLTRFDKVLNHREF